jgi:arsenate reductase (thioredoxin)
MDKPLILILCTGNSCRSQMAEAILRREAGLIVQVESAGSDPAKHIHPKATQVMNEVALKQFVLAPNSLGASRSFA